MQYGRKKHGRSLVVSPDTTTSENKSIVISDLLMVYTKLKQIINYDIKGVKPMPDYTIRLLAKDALFIIDKYL